MRRGFGPTQKVRAKREWIFNGHKSREVRYCVDFEDINGVYDTMKRGMVCLFIVALVFLVSFGQCESTREGLDPFYLAGRSLFESILGRQGVLNEGKTNEKRDLFPRPPATTTVSRTPSSTIWHLHPTKTTGMNTGAPTPISSNKPIRFQINPGEVHKYELSGFNLSGDHTNLYTTINVCSEPQSETLFGKGGPNGLLLYASNENDTDEHLPGIETQFGFANVTLLQLNNTYGIAMVVAPELDDAQGNWTYEIGMSTVGPIHSVNSHPNLYLVDTDFANALFVTGNLTENRNVSDYDIYIYSATNSINRRLMGSYCALSTRGALLNTKNTNVSTTTRGPGKTKGQFFVHSLNKSTNYFAYLTQPNINMEGGVVFHSVNYSTKAEQNCQLVFDLEFCADVAFAVPGNASMFEPPELGHFYDEMARHRYTNFSRSLENVACNATDENRYSLMRNCDNCADSYKQWLCAVTIPRCTDYTLNHTFLRPVKAGQSRNPEVNKVIRPGKYKEIMPCADLCYRIVQDCDPSFAFQCPKKGRGLENSYGEYSDNGDISCSYPGAVYFLSAAHHITAGHFLSLLLFAISLFILW